jgi:hypothetical protein
MNVMMREGSMADLPRFFISIDFRASLHWNLRARRKPKGKTGGSRRRRKKAQSCQAMAIPLFSSSSSSPIYRIHLFWNGQINRRPPQNQNEKKESQYSFLLPSWIPDLNP